jgi:taurine dioxygenase
MEMRRISPVAGVEVTGVDLAQPVGDNLFRQLHQAWLEAGGVLVVRDQNLTPEQHIAFSRRFGTLAKYEGAVVGKYLLPGYPEIYRVSNKVVDGVPQGREDAGTYWHSDGSWETTPLSASVLHALEIPPIGGDTIFANMHRAYETLSEPMKKMLEGLKAEHSLANATKTSYAKEFAGKNAQVSQQSAIHPIVRTHPESGRKALFVNEGFTSHIVGLPRAESDAILGFLFRHSISPEMLYRHSWRLHDLVIWDNRSTMHYAVSDYKGIGSRYMHRTSVMGDVPH